MTTITEDYVSFETAKLLNEKGFDECIFEFYEGNKIKYARNGKGFRPSELGSHIYYPHITHQLAMKWLREVHNIIIEPGSIWNGKKWEYQLFIVTPQNANFPYCEYNLYKSYEKCVEAGLKYCLENLI